MSHSPKPWQVVLRDFPLDPEIHDADGNRVATLNMSVNPLSNTHLLIMAPELLAICRELRDDGCLDWIPKDKYVRDLIERLETIVAACGPQSAKKEKS